MIVSHALINQYRVNLRSRNLVIGIVSRIISHVLINQYRVNLRSGESYLEWRRKRCWASESEHHCLPSFSITCREAFGKVFWHTRSTKTRRLPCCQHIFSQDPKMVDLLDPGTVFSMEEFTSLLISSAVTWKKPWTVTVFNMEEFTSVDLICCYVEEPLNYHGLQHGRVHFSVDLICCHVKEALNYCPGINVRVDWG